MRRPSGEATTAFISAALLVSIVVVIFDLLPSTTLAFALGIPSGALSGFLVTLGIYFLQQPSFSVRVAPDKYDPKSGPWYFTHVQVKNNSRGFLGGGVATDCRGQLAAGGTVFSPKWAARPEPLSWHLVPTGAGAVTPLSWIDMSKIEDGKVEVLGPDDEKALDVVVKVKGDANAYIHEPENYLDPLHKRALGSPGCLRPGVHELTLALSYRGGKSRPFKIRVNNQDSTAPESVSICVIR